MERTGWRGQNESQIEREQKRNGRLVVLPRPAKHAEWRRLLRKNLKIMGLPKRKEWLQCHKESSWQVCRNHSRQKEKEQARQSRVPDHEEGESQGGREPHLGEREEDQSGGMERKA